MCIYSAHESILVYSYRFSNKKMCTVNLGRSIGKKLETLKGFLEVGVPTISVPVSGPSISKKSPSKRGVLPRKLLVYISLLVRRTWFIIEGTMHLSSAVRMVTHHEFNYIDNSLTLVIEVVQIGYCQYYHWIKWKSLKFSRTAMNTYIEALWRSVNW